MNYGGNNSSVECILRPINLKYSMHLKNVWKDNCIKRKGKIYLFCRHHLGGPIYLKHFLSCSYVHSHLSYLSLNCCFLSTMLRSQETLHGMWKTCYYGFKSEFWYIKDKVLDSDKCMWMKRKMITVNFLILFVLTFNHCF